MSKRASFFGNGRAEPLDREAKIRIIHLARALRHRTRAGKAYGLISAKAFFVLEVLLYQFHNSVNGRCFPSLETIAERAGCARSTVALALKSLEAAKLLSWHNRIIREHQPDQVRVFRTSNAYWFLDPKPSKSSKSESWTRSRIKFFQPISEPQESSLDKALKRALEAFQRKKSCKLPM